MKVIKSLEQKIKIISGQYKGRKINTPLGWNTRPSASRVKESLFNILENWDNNFFNNKNILDIFSGTGALGFEALSRGAKQVLFIENDIHAINTIKHNAKLLKVESQITILKEDATAMEAAKNWTLQHNNLQFDIIFADPPYNKNLGQIAFEEILKYNLIKVESVFILEESKKANILFSSPLKVIKERTYGNTSLYFCMLENKYNDKQ